MAEVVAVVVLAVAAPAAGVALVVLGVGLVVHAVRTALRNTLLAWYKYGG